MKPSELIEDKFTSSFPNGLVGNEVHAQMDSRISSSDDSAEDEAQKINDVRFCGWLEEGIQPNQRQPGSLALHF